MLEIYNILYKGKKCGELHYNTETDKFRAYLLDKSHEFPYLLFTIKGLPVVEDDKVRKYFKGVVAPPTRENIRTVLDAKGLKNYSYWGLYKANGGSNANDYATIELKEIKEN